MLAIIDGDVLCYQACRARWQTKAKIKEGVNYVQLDQDGKRVPLQFTKEEDKKYLEDCWENLKEDLQTLLDTVYCSDYVMAVKGEDNFRELLHPGYKMNRRKDLSKRNIFVPVLRKLLVHENYAVEALNREADDLLRIWAEEARSKDIDYIICSIDKDLKCIPGKHWFIHKNEMVEISEAEAMHHYYWQLLVGDSGDKIPGVLGCGKKTADILLALCKTEEEYQEVVVEQYIFIYGDEWKEQLLVNGRMIHLQRHVHDYFNPREWAIIRGLEGVKPLTETDDGIQRHIATDNIGRKASYSGEPIQQRTLDIPGADG
jgi:5'-3' exonuclease